MKRATLILVILPLVVSLSGCIAAAVAAGATGVYYIKGAAEKTYPYDVEKVYNATLAALADADIQAYQKSADATVAKIEATLADGKRLIIDVETAATGMSKVRIRIGTFGDKDRSQFIFSKIDKRL